MKAVQLIPCHKLGIHHNGYVTLVGYEVILADENGIKILGLPSESFTGELWEYDELYRVYNDVARGDLEHSVNMLMEQEYDDYYGIIDTLVYCCDRATDSVLCDSAKEYIETLRKELQEYYNNTKLQ
jgi:hypothetical protein